MARSGPRPPFRLPEATVAVHTSRLYCRKAGKARIIAPVRESSGESRLKFAMFQGHHRAISGAQTCCTLNSEHEREGSKPARLT